MAISRKKISWKRILRPGMKGQDVTMLQHYLEDLNYYTGECHGIYDIFTKGSVFDLQKAHRLRVDGIAGKEVFSLLNSGLGRRKVEHIVKKNETLYNIARDHKISKDLLVNANSLTTEIVEEGDSLIIPETRLFGFCSLQAFEESSISLEHMMPFLTAIAPRWFFLNEHGDIRGTFDKRLIALAKLSNIEVWPVVCTSMSNIFSRDTNENKNVLNNILADNHAYTGAIKSLIKIATQVKGRGLILSINDVPKRDSYAFQSFLRRLKNTLKQDGFMFALEMPLPFESIICQGRTNRKNIKDLGDIVSCNHLTFFRIYKNPQGLVSPGPIVSSECLKSGLRGLAGNMDFWKTVIIVPAFGIDFSSGLGTVPLKKRYHEIAKIIELYKPTIEQPDGETSKVFRYGSFRVNHTIYFEDAESIGNYIDLIQKYSVAGIGISCLGSVDPLIWSALRTKFRVIKGKGDD